jgi:hypothetical protein
MGNTVTLSFFNDLFNNNISDWISVQRWYLEKSERIIKIEIEDFFDIPTPDKNFLIYGIFCNMHLQDNAPSYFIPIVFCNSKISKNKDIIITPVNINGLMYDIIPAEHMIEYQKVMCRLMSGNEVIKTLKGNKIVFHSTKDGYSHLSSEVKYSKNLLEGTGDTSSNILTDIENDSGHAIIKTIKKGKEDIEMEIYDALSIEGYYNIPVFYGMVYLEYINNKRTPLCLAIEKITGPEELKKENWRMKSGFIISDIFRNILDDHVISDISNCIEHIDKHLEKSIMDSINPGNKFSLKNNTSLTYNEFIKSLGKIISGFNIMLAESSQTGFGITIPDKKELQTERITCLIDQISEKSGKLHDSYNLYFKEKFDLVKEILSVKTGKFIESLPEVFLSRVHGDMQMDQILFNVDFKLIIIDLGGAPADNIEKKRSRTVSFYDIAGLIRAFCYIKYYVLKKSAGLDSKYVFDENINKIKNEFSGLIEYSGMVESRFSNILIDSFIDHIEHENSTDLFMRSWDRLLCRKMIQYCVISRALYEINYEISARPAECNALIPLESVHKLVGEL